MSLIKASAALRRELVAERLQQVFGVADLEAECERMRKKRIAKAVAKVEGRRLPNMSGCHFVAIDPGTKYYGWAEFRFGHLLACGYTDDLGLSKIHATYIDTCVIEKPEIYARQSGVNNRDIAELAFSAGEIAGAFKQRSTVYPRQWKGTVKGDVMCRRIHKALRESEPLAYALGRLPAGKHEHVLDACGLGLRCCGVTL